MPARRGPTARLGAAAGRAARAPGRVRARLVAASWWVGWLGIAALAAVGALALVDEEARPLPLADDDVPVAAVAALATASLLGWGCMQRGQERIRRRLGRPLAFVVFALLPLGLTALGFAHERAWVDVTAWPRGDLVAAAIRWVPPALIGLCLLAFLLWRARPRTSVRWGRGAWWALLVLPYAALVAVLVLRVPVPDEVHDGVTDSLATLGRGALALQLAFGHLLRDAGSG